MNLPIDLEFTPLLSILMISAALAYPLSFMHNRKIGYVSLLQVFYLVLLPGIVYILVFSEMLEILARPLNPRQFLSDRTLVPLLMISLLYTYGGVAIHSLTKTLSRYFSADQKKTEVYEVNEAFHLNFSHNLIYSGAVLSTTFFALLELNHVSPYGPENGIIISILNGVFVGLATIAGLGFYLGGTKFPWRSLRFFFASFWIAAVLALSAAKPYFKELRQYPLMLTLLVAFLVLFVLNFFLYLKRVKGHLRLLVRLPKFLLGRL